MLRSGRQIWVLIGMVTVLFWFGSPCAVCAQGQGEPEVNEIQVQVLSSTPEGLRLEIRVPEGVLQQLVAATAGQGPARPWGELGLLSLAGAPELPVEGVMVGLPTGAAPSLEVLDLEEEVLPGQFSVAPAPTQRLDWTSLLARGQDRMSGDVMLPLVTYERKQDPAIYGADRPFPQGAVALEGTGYLRSQQVARLVFYPLRFNPVQGQLTATRRAVVSVQFGTPAGGGQQRQDDPSEPESFERLLREQLVNYESARNWRASTPLAETTMASPLANGQYKVVTEREGIYRLTRAALQAAGLPVDSVDPRTFQLLHAGAEVDIYVAGQGDGSFDPGDYVLFYAEALRSKYSRANAYWLTHSQATGQRMGERNVSPSGTASVPGSFAATLRLEDGYWYVPSAPGGDDLDRWLWARIYPPSEPEATHTFALANLPGGGGTASLKGAFLGQFAVGSSPDHHLQVYLNDHLVEDAKWDGKNWYNMDETFAQSHLNEGQNTIRVVGPNDLGLGVDLFFDDWYELTYQDSFVAEGNELAFAGAGPGTWEYQISGYNTGQVSVFDVTDPARVKRLVGAAVEPFGGGFRVRMEDTSSASSRYLALANAQWRSPGQVVSVLPSNLRSNTNRAGYLIVTDAAFVSAMEPLKARRTAQGLEPRIVTTQEIYNEFGAGIVDPNAIREFLRYAHDNWQRAPEYVLFGGDGHADFLQYRTTKPNIVPPFLAYVDPLMGETAVDNRYVAVSGADTLPDMIAGRLPFASANQAATMVNKILGYETASTLSGWNGRLLFAADDADQEGDYPAMSDQLIADHVGTDYTPQRTYLGTTCPSQDPALACRNEIVDAVNQGVLMVHYAGQGWEAGWASESMFLAQTVGSLSNGTMLPVVVSASTLDGNFAWPFVDAMAEGWLRASGKGGVASWAATGMNLGNGQRLLSGGFLEELFRAGGGQLGAATLAGKLDLWQNGGGADRDLIDTYTFFGDPALVARTVSDQEISYAYLPLVLRSAR